MGKVILKRKWKIIKNPWSVRPSLKESIYANIK